MARRFARYLLASGPQGDADDITGHVTLPNAFALAVSAPEGSQTSLVVIATERRKIPEGAHVVVGGVTGVVAQSMVFTPGSVLPSQFTIQLAAPIVVPAGGWDAEIGQCDPKPPPADSTYGYVTLDEADSTAIASGPLHKKDSEKAKWKRRSSDNKLEANPETRPTMTITGPGNSTDYSTDTHNNNKVKIDFDTDSSFDGSWIVDMNGVGVQVDFSNGKADYRYPRTDPVSFQINGDESFYVPVPFRLTVFVS